MIHSLAVWKAFGKQFFARREAIVMPVAKPCFTNHDVNKFAKFLVTATGTYFAS